MQLCEARVRRLLSVRELAKRADVAPATIYYAERGQKVPQFETIRKIATALDMEPGKIDEFRATIEAALEGKAAV